MTTPSMSEYDRLKAQKDHIVAIERARSSSGERTPIGLWLRIRAAALCKWWRGEPVVYGGATISAASCCVHCGAPADEAWYPSVCALDGEPKEWRPLCRECDIKLNEMTVRFLYGDERDGALYRYANRGAA